MCWTIHNAQNLLYLALYHTAPLDIYHQYTIQYQWHEASFTSFSTSKMGTSTWETPLLQ